MKQFLLKSFAVIGVGLVVLNATAAPSKRIAIDDETVTTIYAVGATDSNKGVYTLSTTSDSPSKISTGYIQYSFSGSGGTFVDEQTLYGTAYVYGSTYGVIATAEGGDDGAWTHTFYNYKRADGTTIPATCVAKDMTYSTADEKIYGIFRATATTTSDFALCEYDGENVAVTKIADLPLFTTIYAIAADDKGTLYGINGTQLVTIDKTTAAVTVVGNLGVSATGTTQSATIDVKSGKMYWIANASTYSTTQSLYEVDLTTGAATKLYDLAGRYSGLYIPAPKASDTAPAAPENLSVTFTGKDTDMTVAFTMPSKRFGGSTLTGELTYTIFCDGTEVTSGTAQAGADVETVVSLEAGNHTVAVSCSNGNEDGPRASVQTFVGFDNPTNISALTATAEGNKVTLSWEAPGAANGGILDESKLSYTVTRNPGAVEVATGLKELTFIDEVPESTAAFFTWTVSVNYNDDTDLSLTSDGILLGKAYTLPYYQNFDDATTLGDLAFFQINNEYGNSRPSPEWTLAEKDGNKYAEVSSTYYFNHNDYLFSAPIEFTGGLTYTLKFKLASSGANPTIYDWTTGSSTPTPYDLKVFLTNAQSEDAGAKVEGSLNDTVNFTCTYETVGVFTEQTLTFTVPETGVYYLCFLEQSPMTFSGIALRLDDIEVTAEYQTPAAPQDFSVTASAEYNRDLILEFTAPSTDVNGEELKSLTGVNIYRGSTLIETLTEGIAPGASVTWVDKEAPRGLLAYHITAVNGTETSTATYATVRSGYLNNLEIVEATFPTKIEVDGEEMATVTIYNNAFEHALDYRVVLKLDGGEISSYIGEPLAPDQEKTYEFYISWADNMPETVKITIEIEFYGDENLDNNVTEEHTLEFATKTTGVESATAEAVKVAAAHGTLTVTGAEGLAIRVFSADGREVTASYAHGDVYTTALEAGFYVVTVDNKAYKVKL